MKSLATNNTFVNENNAKINRVEELRPIIRKATFDNDTATYAAAVEENNRLLRELAAVGIKARHNTWLLDGTEIR